LSSVFNRVSKAIRSGDTRRAADILENDKQVTKILSIRERPYGRTLLHIAAATGYADQRLITLIHNNVAVDTTDSNGKTALVLAAQEGYQTVVQLLLGIGAATNVKVGSMSRTALHWACVRGNKKIVKTLIQAGADVNAEDRNGDTPLRIAVTMGGDPQVMQTLLSAGANVDVRDEYGNTALYSAILWGRTIFVRSLLEHGANPTIISKKGETPESLGRRFGGPIAELFNFPPPLKELPVLAPSEESQVGISKPTTNTEREKICKLFRGCLWSPQNKTVSTPTVWDLIYGQSVSYKAVDESPESRTRWIHLPFTNVSLAILDMHKYQ
jgi:ankyrin repeat protein